MRQFAIMLAVQPVTAHMVYKTLPLHCTLVQYFYFSRSENVLFGVESLRDLAQHSWGSTFGVPLTAWSHDFFGPHNNVPVYVLRESAELAELHARFMTRLRELGARVENPAWADEGYRPHIAITNGICVAPGYTAYANQIYLIEKISLLGEQGRLVHWVVSC